MGVAEFVIGGVAACGAGIFTNPLEVVKTRMQLQGELKARGRYAIFYKNSLHAFYTIAKTDGLSKLQSGLVPALWYQFFMNGFRLGSYQVIENLGLTKDSDGRISFFRCILAGAFSGCVGASVGSPFYMVKTHLQARASQEIAVGTQHAHDSMFRGFTSIFAQHGILGLWRGVSAAITRVMVGSAAQLSTFSNAKKYLVEKQIFPPDSLLCALAASIMGGFVVTICMTPFDVISTRMYNQSVSAEGKGHIYSGIIDCAVKINKKEGLWGFYKGWGPSFLRLGPHTVLSLVFWDRITVFYTKLQSADPV